MPVFLPILMIATWLSAMLAIKFFLAPLIVAEAGWAGVALTIGAILAAGRLLED